MNGEFSFRARALRLASAGLGCALLFVAASSPAPEVKNGLQIEVLKKTADRNDTRDPYFLDKRIDRAMTLRLVAKNVSMKPMAEGAIEYSILVKKWDSTTPRLYTGTAKLPPLKPAQQVEVELGGAQVGGYQTWYGSSAKDKLDYKVVVRHGALETVKVASLSNFDSAAGRAQKMTTPAPNSPK